MELARTEPPGRHTEHGVYPVPLPPSEVLERVRVTVDRKRWNPLSPTREAGYRAYVGQVGPSNFSLHLRNSLPNPLYRALLVDVAAGQQGGAELHWRIVRPLMRPLIGCFAMLVLFGVLGTLFAETVNVEGLLIDLAVVLLAVLVFSLKAALLREQQRLREFLPTVFPEGG